MIVELARQVLALLLLGRDQLLRQLPELALGMFRARTLDLRTPLEHPQPGDHDQGDHEVPAAGCPTRAGGERLREMLLPSHHLGPLVARLALFSCSISLGDRQHGLAPRQDLPPQEAGAI